MKNEVPISVLMQYFRVPTGDIPVDYPGRDVLLGSRITNISTTGVFIRTNKPLVRGTSVEFLFRLPQGQQEIRATGVVRWASGSEGDEEPELGTSFGMGVEFTHLSRRDKRSIEKYVRDFLSRMRRV